MPRLPRKNPASSVDNPVAPPGELGEHQSGVGHLRGLDVYLGRLPADPTYLPDDGVCRIWHISGALKCNFGGNTYTIAPLADGLNADASADLTLTTSWQDVVGATVTLDRTGTWLIIGTFHLKETAGAATLDDISGQLLVNSVAQTGGAQSTLVDAFEGQTVSRAWIVSGTNGHVAKLQAKKQSAPGTFKCKYPNTGITAICVAGVGGVHDAVTLAADAQELLNLSTQELGFVAQVANQVFAGPAAGGNADPDFRVLVEADIPALAAYVTKALFNAHTILMAVSDNTPTALTVAASRIVGRKSSGNIAALTGAEIMALLSGKAGANFSMNTHKIIAVVDPTSAQHAATKAYVDARKQLKCVPFAATQENAQIETMLRPPGICIGESGDMGTVTAIRFKGSCGTAGVTGTMTISLWAATSPTGSGATKIAEVSLTTGTETDTTTGVGGNWASWNPVTHNWLRVNITAIHSGTPAKDVAADFYYEVTGH